MSLFDCLVGEPTTPDLIRDLKRAIRDCDRYINIEGPRAADVRPPEVARLLAFYIDHRAKLQAEHDNRIEALFGRFG